jgi:hypothetical protein
MVADGWIPPPPHTDVPHVAVLLVGDPA